MRRYYVTAHYGDGHTAVYKFMYLKTAIKFCQYLWENTECLKFVTMASHIET